MVGGSTIGCGLCGGASQNKQCHSRNLRPLSFAAIRWARAIAWSVFSIVRLEGYAELRAVHGCPKAALARLLSCFLISGFGISSAKPGSWFALTSVNYWRLSWMFRATTY